MKLLILLLLCLTTGCGTLSCGGQPPLQKPMPYDSVDCDQAHGDPAKCTVEGSDTWVVTPVTDVIRHVTEAVGTPHHQHCTNGGIESQLTPDGFLDCTDSFTNLHTNQECKINPDQQNQFICRQP